MHPTQADGFEWDEYNEEKLAQHGITPEEVEQVFLGRPAWAPNKKHRRGAWKMVGWTMGGRRLTIIINVHRERATLDVVTGYDATDLDIARYLSKRRGR